MASFTLAQTAYRFYANVGTESTLTTMGAQTTNQTLDGFLFLRVRLQETAGKSGSTTDDFQLQVSKNSGAFANITSSSTGGVKAWSSSAVITDAAATTNQLGAGSGSFVAGLTSLDGLADNKQITASNFTEFLYSIYVDPANSAVGDTFDFRVLLNAATITYTVTPRLTRAAIDKYWVGGTGTWDLFTPTHWASSSGGTGGSANAPDTSVEVNSIHFDASSGAGTATINSSPKRCVDFTMSGSSVTITGSSTSVFASGGITLDATAAISGTTFQWDGSGSKAFTTAGSSSSVTLVLIGTGTLTQNGDAIFNTFQIASGTYDAATYNVAATTLSRAAGTATLKMGSGTWSVGASGTLTPLDFSTTSGFTLTPQTSLLNITGVTNGASDYTLQFGGLTYNNVEIAGGGHSVTIVGSNTFAALTIDPGAKMKFTDGTTQTVTSFVAPGTSGSPITLDGTSTAGWTISDSSGTNSVTYCTISHSTATGGANWSAPTTNGNVNGGNNSGWAFVAQTLVTFSQATLKFAGFALGTNARTMTAINKASLTFAETPLGANAKTMTTIVQGTFKFAGFAEAVRIVINVPIVQGLLKRLGFVLPVNAKTMTAISQGILKFAGFPLGANGKTMTAINQALLKFAGFAMTVSSAATTPFSLAALKFAGFPLAANARTQTAVTQATLKFAGFALGTNAKSMLAFSKGTLTWAGRVVTVNARTQTAISQALMKFAGFALPANAKTMTAVSRGTLTLAGGVLPINAKTMTTVAQATLAWAGRTLNANAKSFVVMTTAAIFFAGTPLGVAGLLTIPFGQALLRFSGQALQLTVPGLARLLQLLGVGR